MSDAPTGKHVCLCCGQLHYKERENALTPRECEEQFDLLQALGYTRDELLTKHHEQVEYQLPGMTEWLKGN